MTLGKNPDWPIIILSKSHRGGWAECRMLYKSLVVTWEYTRCAACLNWYRCANVGALFAIQAGQAIRAYCICDQCYAALQAGDIPTMRRIADYAGFELAELV